ncbi:MAG: 16S rRNA (guanine(966)-N(2))-methyltransferase RsmD [Ectothiorhodospiraceae bacterium]|nr:16S rRNA (guanine(966)-N(2))-methyltransferase RsmD [Ectothiorhodospiraceae bacterium]
MRIISGEFGGRILKSPSKSLPVRPTTDRVKESLFSMLTNLVDFDGMTVCDLFAGTGSLGFEALSRGAAHVTFVERSAQVGRLLRGNTSLLRVENRCKIWNLPTESFLMKCDQSFDLIFADPPYAYEGYPRLLELIAEKQMFNVRGLLIVEHGKAPLPQAPESLKVHETRQYGDTSVTIYKRIPEEGEPI